jgi:hypothetical protein
MSATQPTPQHHSVSPTLPQPSRTFEARLSESEPRAPIRQLVLPPTTSPPPELEEDLEKGQIGRDCFNAIGVVFFSKSARFTYGVMIHSSGI